MSDLVKRLREKWEVRGHGDNGPSEICQEAASEIERLTTALSTARGDALEEADKAMRNVWHEVAPQFNDTCRPQMSFVAAKLIEAHRSISRTTS